MPADFLCTEQIEPNIDKSKRKEKNFPSPARRADGRMFRARLLFCCQFAFFNKILECNLFSFHMKSLKIEQKMLVLIILI